MRRITVFCLALPLILLGLTGLAVAQNVSIQLTPQGVPIQIPATGGSFSYTIAATNNGTTPQQATVWCMVTLPNGNPYGPVLGPVNLTLWPGSSLERNRTQQVPAGAPAGSYSFNAYVGIFPDSIWDSDSFPFEKLAQSGGAQLWVAYYPASGTTFWGYPHNDVAVDSGGNVYTISRTGPGESTDYATIKYSSAGEELWTAIYNGPANGPDDPVGIAVDLSGNVYVTGTSKGSGGYSLDFDYATIKYNTAGELLWIARHNGPGTYSKDLATCLAIDAQCNVYVTGCSDDANPSLVYEYATVKYDSDGIQQWEARYSGLGPSYSDDYANYLTVDGHGNVYVTGSSNAGDGYGPDYATIKYNADGQQQWVARFNGSMYPWWDDANCVAADESGNVYVTGVTASGAGDFATIKYNAAGVQQWIAFYNGPFQHLDEAKRLALDASGHVYVTGFSNALGGSYEFATVKYDMWGNQQWVARYANQIGPADFDYYGAHDIVLDSAGNVYVTGGSRGVGTWCDFATIKYDGWGNQLWVARYNGGMSTSDWANAIALDLTNSVIVTGPSEYCGQIATIKYSGGNIDNWMPVEATVFGQPLPQECRLEGNFPNPFNAMTAISYQLSANSYVNLRVYDTAGRLVASLVDGWRSAGAHELTFDAGDLPSGMYFAKMQAGEYVAVQKLVLLK